MKIHRRFGQPGAGAPERKLGVKITAYEVNMNEQGAYGGKLGLAFRQQDAPSLVSHALRKSAMAITELRCDQANFGRTANIPREDAYLVGLQLRACLDHDLYLEGRPVRPINWSAGALTLFDLRSDPVAEIRDPFHCLMFYLPQTALEDLARQEGAPHKGNSSTRKT